MPDPIPYLDLRAQIKPLRAELDAAIAKTIDNCSFCLGPDVAQFEKDFAKYCGAEHCVAFNSGTSALHVAMLLMGVGSGPETGGKSDHTAYETDSAGASLRPAL
jgi:dTDP-4-amino-4,6-dideoxygalactose transaminase